MRRYAVGLAMAVVALATAGIAFADHSPPDGPAVDPSVVLGNPSCDGGTKIDPATSGVYAVNFEGFAGTITITVVDTATGPTFTFVTDHPSHLVTSVLVKGGPSANLYNYLAAPPAGLGVGLAHDDGLRSPFGAGPGGSKSFGLSHLCFFTDKK
jgi:hypothetical protein